MESPGLVILAILGVGALFVLLPVALTTLSEHRRPRSVVCPETDGPATVNIDAGYAARSALFGWSRLRVEKCSLWPKRSDCEQACVAPAPEASSSGQDTTTQSPSS